MAVEEDRRRRAEGVIVEAAMRALFRDGPAATVDAVAELAGVGRATVFRYFPSRDALLAAGLRHAYAGFTAGIPRWNGGDGDEWLTGVLVGMATRNIAGGIGYQRALLDPGHGELADVLASRSGLRRDVDRQVAGDLWRACGRRGRAPQRVVDAVSVLTGPNAMWSLHVELGMDAEQIAAYVAWMLRAVVAADGPR